MNENYEKHLKTIKVLLIVLIVTTAATAGLVGVMMSYVNSIMTQWKPVAEYYQEGIAEEKAYEEQYGDGTEGTDEGYYDDLVVDEEGNIVEDGTVVDEGDGTVEDSAALDENGEPIDDGAATGEDGAPVDDSAGDETTSDAAAQ
ncbi:MAG: hypothetical protein LBL54_03280 [Clostridiales Family XIII bacterium]|jgi:hypothetical protein|nr:hypothetical protein [Clostridiales Family XIII bacterium]